MADHAMNMKKEEDILEKQEALVKEERKLVQEERDLLRTVRKDLRLTAVAALAAVAVLAAAFLYARSAGARISFDKAQIAAPAIDLAPQGAGVLEELYVREGDTVPANAPVARVGGELVKTKVAGEIIGVKDGIGSLFNRGQAVVTMIDRNDLRVVVRVAEDKGLKDLRVGQLAWFTVDAFGSRRFAGTVDEISPTSREGGLVFSISDKRETREFDVKVRFDADAHPELKNGMSAKVSVYKD
ncbi:MAG TPA: HlyD family efflux transporter periplasmic adaptor subunit [Patescibacteria group bacterium]|nr:HlyD family efflux transporter periplasmic adaptor subunit [Patescibacteria group bacterium]